MKKSLLLASALLCASSSFAAGWDTTAADGDDVVRAKDAATYENLATVDNNGAAKTFEFKNLWLLSSLTEADNMAAHMGKAFPSGQIIGDVYYTSYQVAGADGDVAALAKYDLLTGKRLGLLMLTKEDGSTFGTGPFGAFNLVLDECGHLCVHSITGGLNAEAGPSLYMINLETGVCQLVNQFLVPQAEMDAAAHAALRIDYLSVSGDITATEYDAVVMTAASNSSAPADATELRLVYRWEKAKGTTEWVGGFEGNVVWDATIIDGVQSETAPAGITTWGGAPVAQPLRGEDRGTGMFYVDGHGSHPVLYDKSYQVCGGVIYKDEAQEAFVSIPEEWTPAEQYGCGVNEFKVAETSFVAYSSSQTNGTIRLGNVNYNDTPAWGGENGKLAWPEVPVGGMGANTGDGRRLISISVSEEIADATGKKGVYLSVYRCNQGMGIYSLAEAGWAPEAAGVEDVIVDQVEGPATYFNLQGVEVANPENGLYIVKRGNKVAKELVK